MAIDKFDIDTIPTLVKTLDTDETVVTVTVYDRVSRSAVPLTPSPATATQYPAGSGSWYWDVAFTTRPTSGNNQYEAFMIGTTYGQQRRILFDWVEDTSLFKGAVYLDLTGGGTAGQGRYVGTDFRPSSNLTDAKAILTRTKGNKIVIKGALTLDSAVDGLTLEGWRGLYADSIVLNNQSSILTRFYNLNLSGQANSTYIYAELCFLTDILDFAGGTKSTTFVNSITKKVGYDIVGLDGNAYPVSSPAVSIDFKNGAGRFAQGKFSGLTEILNFNNAGAVLYLAGEGVNANMGATVLKGQAVLSGSGNLAGATGRTMVTVDEFTKMSTTGGYPDAELTIINQLTPMSLADIYAAKHTTTGTLGKLWSDLYTAIIEMDVDSEDLLIMEILNAVR